VSRVEKGEYWLWVVVAILALALIVATGYRQWSGKQGLPVVYAEVTNNCDLNLTACTATAENRGDVTLTITPRPIPLVKPIKIVVATTVADVKGVDVDFSGVDMDMGFNRFHLVANGNGEFVGDAMLPVCIRSRMTWEAKVTLQRGGETVVSSYQFDTNSTH